MRRHLERWQEAAEAVGQLRSFWPHMAIMLAETYVRKDSFFGRDPKVITANAAIVRRGVVKWMAGRRVRGYPVAMSRPKSNNPFRYFHSSPEVIGLVVMMYVRFPSPV
jgi:hypothetical protein